MRIDRKANLTIEEAINGWVVTYYDEDTFGFNKEVVTERDELDSVLLRYRDKALRYFLEEDKVGKEN